MISKRFVPFIHNDNFYGVNTKDSNENMLPGEWHEDSLNVFSEPQGAFGSRKGFIGLIAATIGAAVAWIGFFQFKVHAGGSTTSHFIGGGSDGKIYTFAASAYTELFSGLDSTGVDDRLAFFTLANTCIIMNGKNLALSYSGTGSAATVASSVTSDFGIEWQRYGWLHSTVDPRLIYYSDQDTPAGAYTNFLNFDYDQDEVTGVSKQGDDMLVGKASALYRVQFRGTKPLFKIYKLQARQGPVNHWVMRELPDGRVIFLADDFNFWMAVGDSVIEVGDNIRNYIKAGIQSRLIYAVSGLMLERDQYWCSFTRLAGSTKNDRVVAMDWSRPYQDKWGKLQWPWFIHSVGAACFAEVTLSGRAWLYSGGYVGKMYRQDSGTNDDGSLFLSNFRSKAQSHGDPTIDKKYDNIELELENQGDWDLNVSFVVDQNAATQKTITQNLLTGVGETSLFDVANFDEDNFSSESDATVRREINRQGKTIYCTFGTSGLDESWQVNQYILHAKTLRRMSRSRES